MTVASLRKELAALLTAQRVAVLATQNDGQPYCSLMAFAAGLDFRDLYFATLRSTRKYANMAANPQVALLVDDRTGQELDFQKLLAVTATGQVAEVSGPEWARGCEIYLTRHPALSEFIGSPGCALMRLRVEKYYLVSKFQEVHELSI